MFRLRLPLVTLLLLMASACASQPTISEYVAGQDSRYPNLLTLKGSTHLYCIRSVRNSDNLACVAPTGRMYVVDARKCNALYPEHDTLDGHEALSCWYKF